MTHPEIYKINDDRFKKWRDDMTKDYFTAVMTVGIGHNMNKDAVTCMTIPEIDEERLLAMLTELHREVTKRIRMRKQRPR